MKSFREQMEAVIAERHSSEDAAGQRRRLKEVCNPASETLITYIRQWNFGSRNIALGRLLECDRWTDKGTLTLECDHKGKPYPCKLPLSFAYERYMYGDQQRQYYPNSLSSRIKLIPANIQKDWAEEIKGLFYDMCHVPLQDFKLICLGKWVKSLSGRNPHAIAGWDREVSEWESTIKQIDAFVKGKEGWAHLESANLQKPEAKREMSQVLNDILANADAIVEPAFKALKEQRRRDNIRQDATRARNDIKGLKGFFQRYDIVEPPALAALGKLINDTESQTLQKGKEP